MRAVTTSHRRRIGLALASTSLVLLLVFANAAAAQRQPGSRGLSELWRTYPLESREGDARIRSGNESDQPQRPPPSSGNALAGPDAGRPPAAGDDSATRLALLVLFLSLGGLTVVVLAARPAVAAGRGVRGSLARLGPDLSRHSRNAQRRTASSSSASGHLAFRAGAAVGAGVGRTGGRVVRLPVRAVTAAGATVRSASVGILSKRGEILLYTLVAVASTAVGIGVASLLTGD